MTPRTLGACGRRWAWSALLCGSLALTGCDSGKGAASAGARPAADAAAGAGSTAASGPAAPAGAIGQPAPAPRAGGAPLPTSAGELRQTIDTALHAWDVPRAVQAYLALRTSLAEDDPELLRQIAWRYLSGAVEPDSRWNQSERQEALGAVGQSGHPQTVAQLGRLAGDPAWELRWSALESLADTPGPAAAEALAKGATDPDRRVRCAAGSLLLERRDARGFKPALECGSPPDLRYRALRLLLEQADQVPAESLRAVTHFEAQEPRIAAISLLARRALPAERPLLVTLEQDTKPLVKRAARCALAVVDFARSDPNKALAPFRTLLAGDLEQRSTAVYLLGLQGPALGGAGLALLGEVLDPAQPALSSSVCVSLSQLGLPDALPLLERVLRGGFSVDVQRKAAMAVGRIGNPKAVPLLRALLAPGAAHPAVQQVAISALAALNDPAALPELAAMTQHPDPALAIAATAALAGSRAPAALVPLRGLVSSPVSSIRARAALGLGAQRDRASLPALARLLADPQRGVQYNAAAAIVRITNPPTAPAAP